MHKAQQPAISVGCLSMCIQVFGDNLYNSM